MHLCSQVLDSGWPILIGWLPGEAEVKTFFLLFTPFCFLIPLFSWKSHIFGWEQPCVFSYKLYWILGVLFSLKMLLCLCILLQCSCLLLVFKFYRGGAIFVSLSSKKSACCWRIWTCLIRRFPKRLKKSRLISDWPELQWDSPSPSSWSQEEWEVREEMLWHSLGGKGGKTNFDKI